MSRFRQSFVLAAVSLIWLSAIGTAESIDPKAGKLAQPKPEPSPVPVQPRSDPTTPSDKLRAELESKAGGSAPRMPHVVLRGRVLADGKPAVALIELDPKQPPLPVSKGSTLSSGGLKLTVSDVTATEVRIEVSPLNETIVLR